MNNGNDFSVAKRNVANTDTTSAAPAEPKMITPQALKQSGTQAPTIETAVVAMGEEKADLRYFTGYDSSRIVHASGFVALQNVNLAEERRKGVSENKNTLASRVKKA